jgi:trigger factor
MQVEVQELGPCRKLLKIEIPKEKIKEELDKNYTEIIGTIVIPGFRRGKVPRKLLEKRFGKKLDEEVKQNLMQESIQEAVEEQDLQPIGEPQIDNIDFDKDAHLRFEVTLDVKPRFELEEYKGIRVEREPIKATDEEIDEALEAMRRSRAELRTIEDGKAEENDLILAEMEILVGGLTIENREDVHVHVKDKPLIDLDVPGLKDKLLGLRMNESCEVACLLPDTYSKEEYQGKEAQIRLKVNELKRIFMPELNDEWAQELDRENLEALREDIRQNLFKRKEHEENHRIEEKILENLIEGVQFDLPESLVEKELTDLLTRKRLRLQYQGKPEEEIQAEVEKIKSESKDEVVKNFKKLFILDKLAEIEKIYATEDEVEERITQMAQNYGKWPNEMREQMEKLNLIGQLRSDIRAEKAKQFLRENAEITGDEF